MTKWSKMTTKNRSVQSVLEKNDHVSHNHVIEKYRTIREKSLKMASIPQMSLDKSIFDMMCETTVSIHMSKIRKGQGWSRKLWSYVRYADTQLPSQSAHYRCTALSN